MIGDAREFFDNVRPALFNGRLSNGQVFGMSAIISEYNRRQMDNLHWLAYILATGYHETKRQMLPVEENLNYSAMRLAVVFPSRCAVDPKAKIKTPNQKALRIAHDPEATANYVYAGKAGNGNEASGDGWLFRGRGIPQTTGRSNYEWAGCVGNPEKMLDTDVSVQTMFTGMIEGRYTGLSLADCITPKLVNYRKARRIINPDGNGELVAGIAESFYTALTS